MEDGKRKVTDLVLDVKLATTRTSPSLRAFWDLLLRLESQSIAREANDVSMANTIEEIKVMLKKQEQEKEENS